jgi:HAD superfamily phosphoserine phosphatase-like hydrolase
MSHLETPSTDLETPVIASDLEGTLTSGETWRGIKAYLEAHGRKRDYDAFMRRHLLDYLGAKIGAIPKRGFQNRWISDLPRLFAGATIKEFFEVAAWVAEHELLGKLRRKPLAELEAAKAGGARVILVSGTYQPVLESFARHFGFEAIGTPLEVVNDHLLTGRLAGPVNVGIIKCSSLQTRIGQRRLTRAYGDTMPDEPMLTSALEAVVVTGNDPRLERLAQQHGWRTLE